MDNTYKNINEQDLNKKLKILIVSDDMISDMLNSSKLNPIVTKLYIRGRKLNFLLFFYHKVLFCCSEKYQTKFYSLLYDENSKSTRAS